jgi:hypothetical protein
MERDREQIPISVNEHDSGFKVEGKARNNTWLDGEWVSEVYM